jgi:pimeloyl-ACP methyl ester carboxylesterase
MKNMKARRKELYGLLGDLPPRRRPISCRTILVEERPDYVLETLRLDLNGIEDVPAYFVRPHGTTGRLPAVLYDHAHGGQYEIGKDEMIAPRGGFQDPPYAVALTRQGCSALCIDHWAFGERRGRRESEVFKEMLWRGQVMWGMMVYDSIRAVDYLAGRDDVDPRRIATLGLSMGSTMAWWLAAADERVKVCIDLCCMTEYESLIKSRGLDGHGIYYYVPRLLTRFSTAQINELICPRAHLCLAGNYDGLTPPDGLDLVDAYLRKAYAAAGRPKAWEMVRYDQGHFENADMRRRVLEFLKKWL